MKVFTYQGVFVRQIGGEGVTNYPIGVGINNTGDILIADNHNNFNLTIFTQEGQLINALESKVNRDHDTDPQKFSNVLEFEHLIYHTDPQKFLNVCV